MADTLSRVTTITLRMISVSRITSKAFPAGVSVPKIMV